jgi:hypothetical protein
MVPAALMGIDVDAFRRRRANDGGAAASRIPASIPAWRSAL